MHCSSHTITFVVLTLPCSTGAICINQPMAILLFPGCGWDGLQWFPWTFERFQDFWNFNFFLLQLELPPMELQHGVKSFSLESLLSPISWENLLGRKSPGNLPLPNHNYLNFLYKFSNLFPETPSSVPLPSPYINIFACCVSCLPVPQSVVSITLKPIISSYQKCSLLGVYHYVVS